MKISIDYVLYHCEQKDMAFESFVDSVIITLEKRYPKLKNQLLGFNKNSKHRIKEEYCTVLIRKLVKSFIKSLVDTNGDNIQDDFLYNYLFEMLKLCFPLVLENERFISSERSFLYEPEILLSFNLLNYLYSQVVNLNVTNPYKNKNPELLLCLNLVRAIRSSIVLFSIGDDVHGYGMFRGIVELLARLILMENFKDDFIKFSKMNALVQNYKGDRDNMDKKDIDEVQKFIKNNELTMSSVESYMLYAWAKDKKGNRIRTAVNMIKEAFVDGDHLLNLYHVSSEFIHEDYFNVDYNYIGMRIGSKFDFSYFSVTAYELLKLYGLKLSKKSFTIADQLNEYVKTGIENHG